MRVKMLEIIGTLWYK